MRFLNLCPHGVGYEDPNGRTVIYHKIGVVARSNSTISNAGSIKVDGIEVVLNKINQGDTESLPAPRDGTMYIVSRIIRENNPNRKDLVSPSLKDRVYDEKGDVLYVRSFDTNF